MITPAVTGPPAAVGSPVWRVTERSATTASAPRNAIYQAFLLRFGPIMMTTMAALLGGLPLALGIGTAPSSGARSASASWPGLIISRLLTLYTTPVVYLYMARLGRLLRGRRRAPEEWPRVGGGGGRMGDRTSPRCGGQPRVMAL